MASNWSELPHGLLSVIALRAVNIQDFLTFSLVCKSWNFVWNEVKNQWYPFQMPWLMLSEITNENPNHIRRMFDLNTRKTYKMSLPQTFGKRCFGSACGWILTLGLDLECHLFNPLSKTELNLPRFARNDGKSRVWYRSRLIHRALVIPLPGDESQLVVVVVHFTPIRHDVVSFARPGDLAWSRLVLPDLSENLLFRNKPENFTSWNGLLLILTSCHGVLCWDFNPHVPRAYVAPFRLPDSLMAPPDLRFDSPYLLECFGDLLLVQRIKIICDDPYPGSFKTEGFKLYKLNMGADWDEVENLGDVSLFVSDNTSMAVSSSNVPACSPNRIYFTDDENHYVDTSSGEDGGLDMGVYSIEDAKIEPLYQAQDARSTYCTPFWFVPRFA